VLHPDDVWISSRARSTRFSDEDLALAPVHSLHNARWWADALAGFDFSREDRNNADRFNRVLWQGLMGDKPYPTVRSGSNTVSTWRDWAGPYAGEAPPQGGASLFFRSCRRRHAKTLPLHLQGRLVRRDERPDGVGHIEELQPLFLV